MKTFKGVILGIIIALLIFFACVNYKPPVDVRVLGDRLILELPLWIVVYISFILGMIFGILLRYSVKKIKSSPETKKVENTK